MSASQSFLRVAGICSGIETFVRSADIYEDVHDICLMFEETVHSAVTTNFSN